MRDKNVENKKGGKLLRLAKCVIAVIIVLIALTIWYEIPVTEHFTVSSGGKVSTPVRFALVTDLHSETYGEEQSELLSMIDKENVDAILMSGDIFDDRFADDHARTFIEKAVAKYPCYYAAGNHEIWSGRMQEMKEFMISEGVVVLDGDASEFVVGDGDAPSDNDGAAGVDSKSEVIDICGVDDPTYMTIEEWCTQLDNAQAQSDPEHFRILLSHRPEKGDIYKNYDFDLVLSGHAHGGQWRIPFTQMGVHAPDQGLLFPKFVAGTYKLSDNMLMIVSRGLTRSRQPYPRFFNHPEVVIVEITE